MAEYTDTYIADVTRYVRSVEQAGRSADRFGDEQDKAALAARRMALAAGDAGDKAARAQRKAAEAASFYERAAKEAADASAALARGEIKEAEAARVQASAKRAGERAAEAAARAVREKERADIAATASALANAKATDTQADQFRQLGRAGMTTFKTVGREGSTAFKLLEGRAKLTVGLIVAGLAALPAAAELAGGAIAAGVGGGMIAMGMAATASNKQVKRELESLKKYVGSDLRDIAKPFVQTWRASIDTARETWSIFSSRLENDFEILAPAASAFVKALGEGFVNMAPGIDSLAKGFAALLRSLSAGLPGAMGAVGNALKDIGDELRRNPEDVANLVTGLVRLGAAALRLVGYLMSVYHAFTQLGSMTSNFSNNMVTLHEKLVAHIPVVGEATRRELEYAAAQKERAGAVRGAVAGQAGLNAAIQLSTINAQTAAGTFGRQSQMMLQASQSAKDLKASLDALSGKELSARETAAAYGRAILAMNAALQENGRAHGFATSKGLANEEALTNLIRTAQANAVAMRDNGASAASTARYMDQMRGKVYSAARQMGYSKKEAQDLANKISGITAQAKRVPGGKTMHYNVSGNAQARLNAISSAAYAAASALGSALAASMRLASGGPVEFAHGGPVAAFANGGMVQGFPVGGMVRGPGTGTSDSIDARLSNGEYVINARAAAMWRPILDAINYGRSKPSAVSASSGSRSYGSDGAAAPIIIHIGGSVVSERNLVEAVRRGLAMRSTLQPGRNGALAGRAP